MSKVFIVHGWSYNLDKWQAILPELKKRGIEPVFLKVPGLTQPSTKVWDIDAYIAWLKDVLKDESHPVVIGHSNGGRIALAYLQRYPDSFKHLILIDSAGLANSSLLRTCKLKILYVLSKLGKPLANVTILRRIFYKVIGARDYYQAPQNMRETMQNMLRADKTIELSKIKIGPTIIWGDQDTITPLKDGQKMHRLLEGSKLHVVNGARHAPQDTNPGEVAELISEAL